jgi:hypothetical protein
MKKITEKNTVLIGSLLVVLVKESGFAPYAHTVIKPSKDKMFASYELNGTYYDTDHYMYRTSPFPMFDEDRYFVELNEPKKSNVAPEWTEFEAKIETTSKEKYKIENRKALDDTISTVEKCMDAYLEGGFMAIPAAVRELIPSGEQEDFDYALSRGLTMLPKWKKVQSRMMEEMAVEAHQFRMTEANLARDKEYFRALGISCGTI